MMKTIPVVLLAASFLSLLTLPLNAAGASAHKGSSPVEVSGYRSHVMDAMTAYYEKAYNKEDNEEARQQAVRAIEAYPDEVNDFEEQDGFCVTPLRIAVHCNDVELVALLLDKGAFPVLPDCEEIGSLFDGDPAVGEGYDIRIVRMISERLSRLRLYERARREGFPKTGE